MNAAVNERQISTAAGGILYDESEVGKPDDALFTRDHWQAQGVMTQRPGGRGQIMYVRYGSARWVVRHYHRGGFMSRWGRDRYVWLGSGRTRSFIEWRILARLHAQGFPVPRPVAAGYRRHGWTYTADIITCEIPDAQTLAVRLAGGPMPPDLWREIGAVIGRLHLQGVHHADLNAHNVLITSQGVPHIIDFDRARVRSQGSWQDRVLERLLRSLVKIERQGIPAETHYAGWRELLAGYRGALEDR